MKVLFLEWSDIGEANWKEQLKRLGHMVDCLKVNSLADDEDEELKKQIKCMVLQNQYELVCSFNFFPLVSAAIKETGCKYAAWVYDSPSLLLYTDEIFNSCNYVFIFDKVNYQSLKNKGVATVYYLPLAGNENLQFATDRKEYISDVSFVGSLYEKKNYFAQISYLPEELKGYLDAVIRAQKSIVGGYFLPELLTPEILKEIEKYVTFDLGEDYWIDKNEVFAACFLVKEIAHSERKELLLKLSEYCRVHLYSDEKLLNFNIVNCGPVAYGKDMYQVFNQSKININSTLRCIESGINLRVMDILSAGGFCLTNYQSELEDYFEIGKDLVIYENKQDLLEKTAYYLYHDDLRKEIAANGMKKVKENYNYRNRVREMLRIIEGRTENGTKV